MTTPDVQIGPNGRILINGEEAEYSGQCRRNFYTTEGFIIKVDNGTPEAENEIRLWATLDERDRPYFVPILCGSVEQEWVCQEHLEIENPMTLGQTSRLQIWREIIDPLRKKYDLWDVSDMYNWGLVDGVPMIYDYGE